jgi:hypothetical protein
VPVRQRRWTTEPIDPLGDQPARAAFEVQGASCRRGARRRCRPRAGSPTSAGDAGRSLMAGHGLQPGCVLKTGL